MDTQDLNNLSDDGLWSAYSNIEHELRSRSLIRTRNIIGDRGEFLVIKLYNSTKGLPTLQITPKSTQNVDAISIKGDRYSIKTITEPNKTTGVFHGCGDIDVISSDKKFEYLVIVQIKRDFKPKLIIELDWSLFVRFRKWHSTMRAWNVNITNELIKSSKLIFKE